MNLPTPRAATRRGELLIDGWAGRRAVPVEVIAETPKRYRVRLLEDTPLPGRNKRGEAGAVILVPKHAVRFDAAEPVPEPEPEPAAPLVPGQLFALGQVVATPGALALGLGVNLVAFVRRHATGDFGTCGKYAEIDLNAREQQLGALATSDDGKLNVDAIRNGGRVLSSYDTPGGRLWVITDGLLEGGNAGADTVTTCLLPDEY